VGLAGSELEVRDTSVANTRRCVPNCFVGAVEVVLALNKVIVGKHNLIVSEYFCMTDKDGASYDFIDIRTHYILNDRHVVFVVPVAQNYRPHV
jgi:hypothetical protein